MNNILIVDDDIEIVELLKVYLKNYNFNVFEANSGKKALEVLRNSNIHIILLDIMMPNMNGYEFVMRAREFTDVPIMFISAKGEDMDKIYGLGLGADDYLSKPFNPLEVVARVQALLRRYYKTSVNNNVSNYQIETIKIDNLNIELESCEVYKDNMKLELTSMEYKLLLFFVQNPNRVFTKQQLYEAVWGEDHLGDDNIIMVYISKLRDKIEDNSKNPTYLKTIRGLGYRFERKL